MAKAKFWALWLFWCWSCAASTAGGALNFSLPKSGTDRYVDFIEEEKQKKARPTRLTSRAQDTYPSDALLQPMRLIVTFPEENKVSFLEMKSALYDIAMPHAITMVDHLESINVFILHIAKGTRHGFIDRVVEAVEIKGGFVDFDVVAKGNKDTNGLRQSVDTTEKKHETEYNNLQWYLSAMSIPEAWTLIKEKNSTSTVKICIADSGIDLNSVTLKDSIGVNVLVNYFSGYDFVNERIQPLDDNGHGTHVSGIIAGKYDKSQGSVAGICPNCTIISCKVLNKDMKGRLSNIFRCIDHCIKLGAEIQYHGWVIYREPYSLKEVFRAAENRGILMVLAAGDGFGHNTRRNNIDHAAVYPAMYSRRFSNVLTVTALRLIRDNKTQDGVLSCMNKFSSYGELCTKGNAQYDIAVNSNYGAQSVHVAAPGSKIISITTNNQMSTMDGSSSAAAIMAGVAGLLMSIKLPKKAPLTPERLKELLYRSITAKMEMAGKVRWCGIVNVATAVKHMFENKKDSGKPKLKTPTEGNNPDPSKLPVIL